jgi:hypothetical protein
MAIKVKGERRQDGVSQEDWIAKAIEAHPAMKAEDIADAQWFWFEGDSWRMFAIRMIAKDKRMQDVQESIR